MSAYDRYQEELKRLQEGPDLDYVKRKAAASLFMDDDTMLEYLASQRFPNDPGAAFRYQLIDGEIMYEDDEGNMQKEFERPGDVTLFGEYVRPNIVPASTVAADMAGGIFGAQKGFEAGVKLAQASPFKHPIAQAAIVLASTGAGGFGGTFLAGAAARADRALKAESFYNLPPEELAASLRDLGVSSAFSLIPFGAGPTKNVINKFRGKEDSLRYLYNLRAGVQGVIDEAAELGIKLTPAEAASISTGSAHRAAQIQFFLSRQPQAQVIGKLHDFYESRAQRAAVAINTFADNMAKTTGGVKSPQKKLAAAAKATIKELNLRRKKRADVIYQALRDEGVTVDLTPLFNRIETELANPKIPRAKRRVLEEFRETLTYDKKVKNPKTGKIETVQEPLTDLMDVHDRRVLDIEDLYNANKGPLRPVIISLRQDLTDLLGDAHTAYNLAKRVYDPTKASLEAVEASAIGRMSSLFGTKNDKAVARSIKEIFDPEASPQSLRNARRVLKLADPESWQEIKKFYLNDQLDRFTREQALEGGVPNFQRHFALPKYRKMLKEILDPQEFDSFYRLNDILGASFNTVRRGASDTQTFQRMEDDFTKEAAGLGADALGLGLGIVRTTGRFLTGQIGDDLAAGIANRQRQAYYDKMVDVMLSEEGGKTIDDIYNVFSKMGYGLKQGASRAIGEGVDALNDPLIQNYEPTEQAAEEILQDMERLEQIENQQSAVNPILFDDLPETTVPPVVAAAPPSATLLPSEEDREIAMRQRQGIGGLVA